MTLSVTASGITSLPGTDTINYPKPIILPDTIRAGPNQAKAYWSSSFTARWPYSAR